MTTILIAGLGSIGRRHLRNLVALGVNDIILLRSHRSTMPEQELSGFTVETDLRAAIESHKPDAVVVANPTALHLDVAIPAAEAGCSILLEKPVSHSLERLDLLQRTVAQTGAKVLVGFQLRHHPGLLRAREYLIAGALGRVTSSRVSFSEYLPAWHPWEDYRKGYAARADLGGGVLLTQSHSLDYLPWLVGDVDAVWGFLARLSDLEVDVEDTAEIGLRFAGGSLGSLHLDYARQPSAHRVYINGTRGSLQCDLETGTTRFYDVERQEWEQTALPQDWERNSMFLSEMRHFIDVIEGRAQPACTLDDGIKVMRLINAVQESNLSGRLVSLGS